MKNRILIVLSGFLVACSGETNNSGISESAEVASQGEKLYVNNCANCHGPDGTLCSNGAADLTQSTLSIEKVKSQVKSGKNTMPSFADLLSEEEIDSVSRYVIQLRW